MEDKYLQATLFISEIFHSIQGESTYAGLPCFFIRLAGCNLNCLYCDTQYALTTKDSVKLTIEQIIQKVKEKQCSLVEITGGEPLAQGAVIPLVHALIEANFKVLFETNGSLLIDKLPQSVVKILDCKCPSSGENEQMLFENFSFLDEEDEIKFVISDRTDYEYAVTIINKYNLYSKTDKILFSPIYTEKHTFAAELAEWVLNDNLQVRINMQLHKILWNHEERGR